MWAKSDLFLPHFFHEINTTKCDVRVVTEVITCGSTRTAKADFSKEMHRHGTVLYAFLTRSARTYRREHYYYFPSNEKHRCFDQGRPTDSL